MKKFLLLLPLLLLCGCSSHPPTQEMQSVGLADRTSAYYYDLKEDTAAIAFTANAPFSGAELPCFVRQTDNRLTLTLYAATGDYFATVEGKALRQYTFTDVKDTTALLWRFDTLPAGSYVLTLSAAQGITVSKAVVPSPEANGRAVHFLNGEVVTDGVFDLRFLFTDGAPADFFAPFSFPAAEG